MYGLRSGLTSTALPQASSDYRPVPGMSLQLKAEVLLSCMDIRRLPPDSDRRREPVWRGAGQVTLPAALSRGVSPSGLALVCRRR